MRPALWLIVLLFTQGSCSRYQYIRISSDSIAQRETNSFVMENDSLRVAYSFTGESGALQIGIVNKSASGLQVDWNHSFLEKGGRVLPLTTPAEKIQDMKKRKQFAQAAVIAGRPDPEFILPKGGLNKESIDLFGTGLLKGVDFRRERLNTNGPAKKIRKAGFDKEHSPAAFRLRLAILPEGSPVPVVLDHSFYVSELMQTQVPPHRLPGKGELVYMRGPSTFTILTAPLWGPPVILTNILVMLYNHDDD